MLSSDPVARSTEGSSIPADRRAQLLLLAGFSAALVLHAASFRYTVDDAFITFRYARNWAEGAGIVFNPGERVEGYTNFLWTALLAAGFRLRLDPVLFSRAAGIAAGLLLLGATFAFAQGRLARRSLLVLVPIPIVANGAFALWCGAGLETPLFALLVFAGVAEGARRDDAAGFGRASVLLALAALTRPEGLLVYAAVVGDRFLLRRLPVRTALPGILFFLAAAGAHEAWRIAYYGDPLPNTYYAKTGGGLDAVRRGLQYAAGYFGPFGGWTTLVPLPLLLVRGARPWERSFLAVVAALLASVVWAGGDSLPFYRFFVPAIPFLAILSVSAIDRLFAPGGGSLGLLRTAGLALLLALPAARSATGETLRFLREDRERIELHWKVIGGWLAEHADAGSTIAVTTAGAIPYYSGLPTIDMLGITDRAIARRAMPEMGKGLAGHEKHDMSYVLSRRPTYILHYPFLLPEPVFSTAQFRTPWNRGLEALLESETFDRLYRGEHAAIVPPGARGPLYFVYFRLREEGAR